MKKLLILPVLLLSFLFITPTFGQLAAGGGIAYGSEVEEIGIQVRFMYGINENWRGAADLLYYLDGEDGVSIWEVNTNLHYIFLNGEKALIYGLAGLNVTTVKLDLGQFGNTSNSEVGLNLGGGAQIPFSDIIQGIIELRYILGDFDQLVIAGGILFVF